MGKSEKLAQLLAEEQALFELEGKLPNYEYNYKLIDLYERFIKVDPSNPVYKNSLGRALLEKGRDIKIRQESYREAEVLFKQLLTYPNMAIYAKYHLGYIQLHSNNFSAAKKYFEEIIKEQRNLRVKYLLRTYLGLAICFRNLNDINKAKEMIVKAKSLDDDKLYSTEIEMVLFSLNTSLNNFGDDQDDLIYFYEDGKHVSAINNESFETKLKEIDGMHIVLDLTMPFYIRVVGDKVPYNTELSTTELQLIKVLSENNAGLSRDSIIKNIYDDQYEYLSSDDQKRYKGRFRTDLHRLRGKLKKCSAATEFIVHRNDKYYWDFQGYFAIASAAENLI